MELLNILEERLRTLCREKGLRQKGIAMLLGITQTHYQRIEKGRINISTVMLRVLADYYEVSDDYLLGRTDQA